jgi:hypothetical protein
MVHPIYKILKCQVIPPYGLELLFNDGFSRIVDLQAVLEGELYGKLKDPYLFAQVALDPEIGTVTWANGADFDPAILHDWEEHAPAFTEAAKRWKSLMVAS